MSLVTPEKIRSLQRKLYRKAKAEPAFRFYVLYDKICREDILRHAYGLARANSGAPGVDRVSFAEIAAQGLEAWLAGLRKDLVTKTYRPDPVRRVMIPKPDGGERPRPCGAWLRHDAFRPSGIAWCRPPPRLCWSRSSRPTSRTVRMATVPDAGRWMQSRKCTGTFAGAIPTWSTPTFPSTSIRSHTPI
jgi:hypothetical protein